MEPIAWRLCGSFHGTHVPSGCVTDATVSEELREFTSANGVRHVFATPYHPSTNVYGGRAAQSFKEVMKHMQPAPSQLCFTRCLANDRLTPYSTTNRSPAGLLLRRRPKSRLDLIGPYTRARMEEKQMRQEMQHDQHAKHRTINPGWSYISV